MRNLHLWALALPAILLTGCKNETTSLSEVENATRADSIAFYYGNSTGFDYWNAAVSDTTFRSDEARKEFLRGVEEGIKIVRENAAYNHGLQVGMDVALNIMDIKKAYPDVDIPVKLYLSSLKGALRNDSAVDGSQVKAELYKIIDEMARQKEIEDTKLAVAELSKMAKQLSMTKINEYLYGKVITPSNGQLLRDGDKARVDITATTVEGTPVGLQFPREIVVGRNLHSPLVSQALRTMRTGQTSQFLASPVQLMPRRYRANEFKADQLIKFTIRVESVANPESVNTIQPEQ